MSPISKFMHQMLLKHVETYSVIKCMTTGGKAVRVSVHVHLSKLMYVMISLLHQQASNTAAFSRKPCRQLRLGFQTNLYATLVFIWHNWRLKSGGAEAQSVSPSSSSLVSLLVRRSVSDEAVNMNAKPIKRDVFWGSGPWESSTSPDWPGTSVPLPEVLHTPTRWAEDTNTRRT